MHVTVKHTLQRYNECKFATLTSKELKPHKEAEHEPDEGEEQSIFDKAGYKKTWKVLRTSFQHLLFIKQKLGTSFLIT